MGGVNHCTTLSVIKTTCNVIDTVYLARPPAARRELRYNVQGASQATRGLGDVRVGPSRRITPVVYTMYKGHYDHSYLLCNEPSMLDMKSCDLLTVYLIL